jgi:hypothetical protein
MGVNFWNDQWTEGTKRNWIAIQWTFKSYRGTEAGLAMAIDYAGRDVTPFGYKLNSVTRRPQGVFSGPSLTKEQREAWLETLPQVRAYLYFANGFAPPWKAFMGGKYNQGRKMPNFFLNNKKFFIPSDAKTRLVRKATYNVNGVDTDVPVVDFGSYYQIRLPGQVGFGVYCNTPMDNQPGKRFFIPSTAWKRIYSVVPDTATPWRIAIGPSLQAISAQPDLVTIAGNRGFGVYTGSNFVHGSGSIMKNKNYFIPSTAKYRIFDRWAIYDGSSDSLNRPNKQFMGTGRYGFPDFTAWADVSMPSKAPSWQAGFGYYLPKGKFWKPHDPRPVAYVRTAAEAARRLHDKVMLDLGPKATFVAGKAFFAGQQSFIVGRPSE